MPIPNVSTLYRRINKGSEGGLEFARIMDQLLIADSKQKGYKYIVSSDASGDYKGVDGIMIVKDKKIGVQFKFFPSPMSSSQKNTVIRSFKKAVEKFNDMTEWILITPEDFDFRMMDWFDSTFNHTSVDCEHWGHTHILDLMLKHPQIATYYYPELKNYKIDLEPTISEMESYFIQFTHSRTQALNLLSNAQPLFSDCQQVFSEKYAGDISDSYQIMYRTLIDSDEPYTLLEKNRLVIKSNTITDIQNFTDQLPGGMRQIYTQYNALRPGARFYYVHYLSDDDEYGISQSIWCHLNGRWVFFPKPWKIIRSIQEVKNSKDVDSIVKLLRIFGFKKYFSSKNKVDLGIVFNHITDELKK